MEAERLSSADRTLAPNRFVIHLHPTDLEGFGDMTGSLASELADGALVFARSRKFTLVDRPRVDLLADTTVQRADIKVVARFADPIAGRERRDLLPELEADDASDGDTDAGRGPADDRGSGPTDTMVFTIPRPSAPTARMRVTPPDGAEFLCEFDGSSLTIGRGPDNDLVAGRRPRVPSSRPRHGSARDARLHRSRQYERLARQRRARSASWSWGRAIGSSSGDTVLVVEVDRGRRLMDAVPARHLDHPTAVPGAAVPVPRQGRRARCCAIYEPQHANPGRRWAAWSWWNPRPGSQRPAARSTSTRSRRSDAT